MKIYKTNEEVKADIKDGVLRIDDDVTFECSVDIEADIKAGDIDAWDINARDINAVDIDAQNINAENINARDINAWGIKARDISYYAVCCAYNNMVCKSIEGSRGNAKHFCLDEAITYKDDDKTEEALKLLKEKGYKIVKE